LSESTGTRDVAHRQKNIEAAAYYDQSTFAVDPADG
jgi:hypothetical protein